MANDPRQRFAARPAQSGRPRIWAEGSQRPRFDPRAFGRASLHLARDGVAPILAWSAQTGRRVAVNVRDGAGRIPEGKLGRFERFVPSHLRVAHWIKTCAAILAHASASADPDVKRGNALVAEIEPHLWPTAADGPMPADPVAPEVAAPVVLAEPRPPANDPLAAIRRDLESKVPQARKAATPGAAPEGKPLPPAPPGQAGIMAVQMTGFALGWATAIVALPYGMARAVWLHAKGVDLRGLGAED